VLTGIAAGILSLLLTRAVYASEDAFQRLPMHWMWWPILGGLAIGIGGLIFPAALGVGYDVIGGLLQHPVPLHDLLGILLVKSSIWAIALGSGTSGGVLAPLLMMGGALGGLEALVLPDFGPGFWPLIAMGAILGGTMRSPFTGVVFALELTHDVNMLLPLLVAVTLAHGFTVLTLRRSILTEKVARRGFHLSREYEVDPLEIVFVREVMREPVDDEALVPRLVTAFSDETLKVVVYRMAHARVTEVTVLDRETQEPIGLISLEDLLAGRRLTLEAENRRERVYTFPFIFRPGVM
jgi:CBS domain-containing protein